MNNSRGETRQRRLAGWSIGQLLRFEQYRHLDREQDDDTLARRDRALWQQYQDDGGNRQNRSELYLWWLQQRQQQQPLTPDAGQLFGHSLTLASHLLFILGLLSGIGITASALQYDGTVPVNVALFLGLLVAPQLLLLLVLVVSLMLALSGSGAFVAWYQPALAAARGLWQWLWRRDSRVDQSGSARDESRLQGQILQEVLDLQRPLFANRALRLMQGFGIAFNLGVVACLLVLLAFTDRAFGWQSSLTGSADTVAALVQGLAWPWRGWFEAAVPTLEQIRHTHILLGQTSLTTDPQVAADFRAWWPFMLMTVLVYGLLPRLLVWGLAVWREGALLQQLDFDAYHYQSLWRRMQSLALSSQGKPAPHSSEAVEVHTPLADLTPLAEVVQPHLFVLADTLSRYPEEYLQHWLPEAGLASRPLRQVATLADVDADSSAWLVLEGWQPPIEETLHQLALLATRLGESGSELHLLLLGKPATTGSKPVTPRLAEVWRKKLDLLQRHNILVHCDSAELNGEAS